MKLEKIKEGKVELFVPVGEKLTKKMSVFYNPEMKFDRDLSEQIISILQPKRVFDCLSASGVRSLRYASVLKDSEVIANDLNPKAIELIKKNSELNNLRIKIRCEDAKKVLLEEKFDFVDIDPFGSPIYFLDYAAKSIKKEGVIAITATDSAPLCGTSLKKCLRRYGIKSIKSDFSKELGLRILLSSSIKLMAKYDIAFIPIFSYYRRHYFRIFAKVKKSALATNELLDNFSPISYCLKCGWRKCGFASECEFCKSRLEVIPGIYIGDFAEKGFCNKLEIALREENSKIAEFVGRVKYEQDFSVYYDIHKICKLNKKPVKKTEYLIEKLNGVRTHFSDTGIKTKKDFKEIIDVLTK